jgi:Bacterial PH domain
MGKLFDIVFNNAYQVDASAAEGNVRRDYPKLLHETERIELAFQDRGGAGRDGQYFTSHRIIIKDGKGVGNKRKSYLTIPYDSILAFGVQTSAAAIDDDVELSLWTTAHTKIKLDMAKGKVDLFQLYQYLNSKIKWSVDRGTSDVIDATPPNMDKKQTKLGNVVDWLGDNAKQIVAADVEKMFKTDYPILLGDEKVELAFKSGRDTTCFTSRRMLIVDVKGMFGKKIEFVTVLYSSIHGFGVRTAGSFFDRDAELKIYTNMVGEDLYEISQDFRQGKANLFAIQKTLANHILGDDKVPIPDIDQLAGHQDTSNGLFQMVTGLRFNQRPIDAVELNRVLHSDPPILQGMEVVEMAFQGHRDLTVFTTKRCIMIDTQGLTGKKVQYFSIPWEKMVAFGIRSAGAMIDFDTEVQLYTEMGYFPGQAGETDPPKPPIPARPEQSFL